MNEAYEKMFCCTITILLLLVIWRVGQAVKTPPFHGGFMGPNPIRVTILPYKSWAISSAGRAPALQAGCRRFDPVIAHHVLFYTRGPVV